MALLSLKPYQGATMRLLQLMPTRLIEVQLVYTYRISKYDWYIMSLFEMMGHSWIVYFAK